MKVLAIIPARGGSKGVPRKNIKLLGGMPLISYTIDSANKSKLLTNIIVSSDDLEIINYVKTLGAKAPFVRPASLSEDDTPTIEVVKHSIRFLLENDEDYESVCILQPTNPFRPNGFIDEAISKFSICIFRDSLMSR